MNRDPIEEDGGINLYGFVENQSINTFDHLGLWKKSNETGKERQIYIREGALDTLQNLAQEVGLEYSEIKKWAKPTNYKDYDLGTFPCEVSVPNIWIAADVGGPWTFNPFSMHFYAKIGMVFGRFIGTDLSTSDDYYKIKPNSAKALYSAVANNIDDIWGIAVFGHGGKEGYLGDFQGKNYINQSSIISQLKKQEFKLAKAYLFQCYSGYQGDGFDWTKDWKEVARDPILYKGQDWIIDMPF